MKDLRDIITEIYCDVDDFCKGFEEYCIKHILADEKVKKVYPKCLMSLSEVMTIVIMFHHSGSRCFKWFYFRDVCGDRYGEYFPKQLSYNRFVEVMQYALLPLLVYTLKYRCGESTGISFIDSTFLDVCHLKRGYSHKVSKGIVKKGKGSTGWHYGFKLHLIINESGEIISFCLTSGNVDDRNIDVINHLCKEISGKLFGDRGYISQKLFDHLYEKSIQLVTKIKKKMKNKLMNIEDKILLRKRAIIESVNDFLKNICYIEHSRHRSEANFYVNLVSGLAAYSFLEKRPNLHLREREGLNSGK
jgi:hypothetical protein